MRVERDGDAGGWVVVADDGRVLALFTQGSDDTQRRHAHAWMTDEFDRDAYEDDLKADYGWTGRHVLKGG